MRMQLHAGRDHVCAVIRQGRALIHHDLSGLVKKSAARSAAYMPPFNSQKRARGGLHLLSALQALRLVQPFLVILVCDGVL